MSPENYADDDKVLAMAASCREIREPIERELAPGWEKSLYVCSVAGLDEALSAIEAMEGTDATIARAGSVAGEGCVMVKVGRPDQDLRWDIPTVGLNTISKLRDNKFNAMAIENGKMFLLERERVTEMADSANIVLEVV